MKQLYRLTTIAILSMLLVPASYAASAKDKDGRFLNRYADLSKSQNFLLNILYHLVLV